MDHGDGDRAQEAVENFRLPASAYSSPSSSSLSHVGKGGCHLEPHFVPWDPTFIRKLLLTLVKKKIGLFAIYPDVGREDLLQIAERAMVQAWAKWKPSRAGLSTYLYMAASNAIITEWREATRRHRGQSSGIEEDGSIASATELASLEDIAQVLNGVTWDRNESIKDWLRKLHDAVKKFPDTRNRRTYTLPQAVAISCLMRRLKLGYQGVREVLKQEPDFMEAIRLKQVPSHKAVRMFAREFLRRG